LTVSILQYPFAAGTPIAYFATSIQYPPLVLIPILFCTKIFFYRGVEKGIGGILGGDTRCGASHSTKIPFTIWIPYGKLTISVYAWCGVIIYGE
jgi:hypothetical protein